ncbi:amidase [Candidatus Acidianus copahuensis]|uniref:Amidase n=2 Tax=Candidatus Acidianus copahuensis TaxID=1160895 RepID=A0A031LPB5_9CREN|nr:amidase [Candidatus Acidianus copahuensis]
MVHILLCVIEYKIMSNISRLKQDMEDLGRIGKDPRGGISRPSMSDPDLDAREFIMEKMREAGLEVYYDLAGNIIGIRRGQCNEFVTTGSHIDTVLNGGMFDGSLGVLGGIEAIRLMNEEGVETKRSLAIIVFTDEEGNAFAPFVGSKYFSGTLDKEELVKMRGKYVGVEFSQVFRKFESRVSSKAKKMERFPFRIKYHVELHVEQGPTLEMNNKDIGIVTGIVGILRLWLRFKGKQSHSGTTPMNMRKDPMIPASRMVLDVREKVKRFEEMVGTTAFMEVKPNVVNVIPGEVYIGIDVRSMEIEEILNMKEILINDAKKFSEEEGNLLDHEILIEEPIRSSSDVMEKIRGSTEELGYSYMELPSRAVHDTQMMAKITKVGMIFVPSKSGISHAPEEWTDWDKAYKGVEVLKETLIKLAKEDLDNYKIQG